ncbi:sonic hedgehog protein isoform X1 [Microplitis demolitor]|uniref:sonic hedgehog protein isoform X1 n=1 Tax=Microplitis demolitor TaxID=69319 RepID=UPI0004CD3EA7|nr:sonic hedgehog protein isoform X1 [Microplitis demolitor]
MVHQRDTARPVSYLRHHHYHHYHHCHHHHHRNNNYSSYNSNNNNQDVNKNHHNENQHGRCRTTKRTRPPPRILLVILLSFWLPALESPGVLACGPGRGGGRRPILRKLTPLVFKQHVPNVSENTLTASGLSEGRVSRHDSRFRDLVPNYNADIIFKDEEGTGADRLMTQRCKERLNTLAISVMNQWPGVKLRVTEGWDEDGKHATDSLHYEGRAVDVTTSDRDRSKYGMLARLAIEAGFDWVYYESRSHIHCSVKSESSSVGKSGGCFPGKSKIRTSNGIQKSLSDLQVGEKIAALDSRGNVIYSEVLAFMDRQPMEKRQFIKLTTSSGKHLTLTPAHLVPVKQNDVETVTFSARVKIGDRILVQDNIPSTSSALPESRLRWDTVIEAKLILDSGVYAPLTSEGTVLIDDVVASCYALVDSQTIAHYAFMPFRFIHSIQLYFESIHTFIFPHSQKYTHRNNNNINNNYNINTNDINVEDEADFELSNEIEQTREDSQPQGVHWYPSFLYKISLYILPSSMIY